MNFRDSLSEYEESDEDLEADDGETNFAMGRTNFTVGVTNRVGVKEECTDNGDVGDSDILDSSKSSSSKIQETNKSKIVSNSNASKNSQRKFIKPSLNSPRHDIRRSLLARRSRRSRIGTLSTNILGVSVGKPEIETDDVVKKYLQNYTKLKEEVTVVDKEFEYHNLDETSSLLGELEADDRAREDVVSSTECDNRTTDKLTKSVVAVGHGAGGKLGFGFYFKVGAMTTVCTTGAVLCSKYDGDDHEVTDPNIFNTDFSNDKIPSTARSLIVTGAYGSPQQHCYNGNEMKSHCLTDTANKLQCLDSQFFPGYSPNFSYPETPSVLFSDNLDSDENTVLDARPGPSSNSSLSKFRSKFNKVADSPPGPLPPRLRYPKLEDPKEKTSTELATDSNPALKLNPKTSSKKSKLKPSTTDPPLLSELDSIDSSESSDSICSLTNFVFKRSDKSLKPLKRVTTPIKESEEGEVEDEAKANPKATGHLLKLGAGARSELNLGEGVGNLDSRQPQFLINQHSGLNLPLESDSSSIEDSYEESKLFGIHGLSDDIAVDHRIPPVERYSIGSPGHQHDRSRLDHQLKLEQEQQRLIQLQEQEQQKIEREKIDMALERNCLQLQEQEQEKIEREKIDMERNCLRNNDDNHNDDSNGTSSSHEPVPFTVAGRDMSGLRDGIQNIGSKIDTQFRRLQGFFKQGSSVPSSPRSPVQPERKSEGSEEYESPLIESVGGDSEADAGEQIPLPKFFRNTPPIEPFPLFPVAKTSPISLTPFSPASGSGSGPTVNRFTKGGERRNTNREMKETQAVTTEPSKDSEGRRNSSITSGKRWCNYGKPAPPIDDPKRNTSKSSDSTLLGTSVSEEESKETGTKIVPPGPGPAKAAAKSTKSYVPGQLGSVNLISRATKNRLDNQFSGLINGGRGAISYAEMASEMMIDRRKRDFKEAREKLELDKKTEQTKELYEQVEKMANDDVRINKQMKEINAAANKSKSILKHSEVTVDNSIVSRPGSSNDDPVPIIINGGENFEENMNNFSTNTETFSKFAFGLDNLIHNLESYSKVINKEYENEIGLAFGSLIRESRSTDSPAITGCAIAQNIFAGLPPFENDDESVIPNSVKSELIELGSKPQPGPVYEISLALLETLFMITENVKKEKVESFYKNIEINKEELWHDGESKLNACIPPRDGPFTGEVCLETKRRENILKGKEVWKKKELVRHSLYRLELAQGEMRGILTQKQMKFASEKFSAITTLGEQKISQNSDLIYYNFLSMPDKARYRIYGSILSSITAVFPKHRHEEAQAVQRTCLMVLGQIEPLVKGSLSEAFGGLGVFGGLFGGSTIFFLKY